MTPLSGIQTHTQTVLEVARYRAALAVIDAAQDRGMALSQEAARSISDAAINRYLEQLSAHLARTR